MEKEEKIWPKREVVKFNTKMSLKLDQDLNCRKEIVMEEEKHYEESNKIFIDAMNERPKKKMEEERDLQRRLEEIERKEREDLEEAQREKEEYHNSKQKEIDGKARTDTIWDELEEIF
jgi:hypothetical protein